MSLFSRARPGKPPAQKKTRGFLALPGELRNKVYGHYFGEGFRCEIASENTDFDPLGHKMMKLGLIPLEPHPPPPIRIRKPMPKFMPAAPTRIRISRRLGKYTRVEGLKTDWLNSLCALILVCQHIHRESVVFLYHNTTFVFNAPKRMGYFMNSLPTNLCLITRLELHYTNYGDNQWVREGLKDKHHAIWVRTCKAVAKRFVNLQELTVWMYITAQPLFFDLRQEWLAPLLPFRRVNLTRQSEDPKDGSNRPVGIGREGLRLVDIQFDTHWSRPDAFLDRPRLTKASMDLHRLFGLAVSRAILGADEEEAMADFKEAWEGKHARWKHHLNFSTTGW
ncbi:hypothetical protein K458DRAFT_418896 [Lentithecium fluviatile CBS 122367]|uniref:DUF7730 domain-containing protein n=1 Tax=Lentithecium fluviatile CBS 122367 TaxID=1168545 RepID=A0A6G1IZ94_9PLEO|nr:hypothetical protein K458DRAFT_418896 [Lentithecium fluviatile CBS 122367]